MRRSWLSDRRVQQEDLQRVRTIATTTARPPTSLFVNRETRDVILRRYPLAFALPGGKSRFCFNFALDTIVLSRHAQLAHAFTRRDFSWPELIRVPKVKLDDYGDYVAVGAGTDCLFPEERRRWKHSR